MAKNKAPANKSKAAAGKREPGKVDPKTGYLTTERGTLRKTGVPRPGEVLITPRGTKRKNVGIRLDMEFAGTKPAK